jgi:3-deoxy-D-manno-octulosonic-acid transferase
MSAPPVSDWHGSERLALAAYSLLMRVLQPFLLLKLLLRARHEPAYRQFLAQRFGYYGALRPDGPLVWVHAVSLGETRALAPLLAQWRAQWPGLRLLLTHGTATGREAGAALLRAGDLQVWQPWDTPCATARFVRHFRPRWGVLLETEVWPNLVQACYAAQTPLYLVNARLSAKSLRQAQRLAALAVPAYRHLAAVWPQSQEHAVRLRALGASPEAPTGNIKFDIEPDPAQWEQGQAVCQSLGRLVVLLASSREGEEQMWLDAWRALQSRGQALPAVQWLIVPRHPQRFDAVAQLLQTAGLTVSRRSVDGSVFSQADVWLGDTLGEMSFYYGLSAVALLGGSFAPLGGQNLIEAAACRCPVVMGPHTYNFAQAAQMAQEAGAALEQANMTDAMDCALALAQDPAALERASSAAWAFAQAHRGAVLRLSQALAQRVEAAQRQTSA